MTMGWHDRGASFAGKLCRYAVLRPAQRLRRLWPVRRRYRALLALGLCAALVPFVVVAAAWVAPFPERLLQSVPVSRAVYDRHGELLRVFPTARGDYLIPVALSAVSPHAVDAAMAIEDRRFRSHLGVDAGALVRALWQDAAAMRVVSGASTITMQVVRMLEPRPRTLWAKAVEMFRALQLERRLTKDEILALYLNITPYGGNLYGIEAAARAYFGVGARSLTLPQAALLAGLPQSPSRLRPDLYPVRAYRRRDLVLRALVRDGRVSAETVAPYLVEPPENVALGMPEGVWVRHTRKPMPFTAPHFSQFLTGLHPELSVLRSTIDGRLQQRAEAFLAARTASLEGVANAALVVVENASGEVRAYVGSGDFWAQEDGGQVDGLRAYRSPGSTLKPFLYAYLYHRGRLAPGEQLADIPLAHSAWSPENYDRQFHGLVPAGEALRESYNLTAARLLARVGADRFQAFLLENGILRRYTPEPGLSFILGAAAARPIDLAQGYVVLGRFGTATPLRFLRGKGGAGILGRAPDRPAAEAADDAGDPVRLFSPEACYLVSEALTGTEQGHDGLQGYAWKTGTSWGRRDAWTCAYTPAYTVVAWVGNFSGKPSPVLVGGQAAMPLAVEVLSWVDPAPSWPPAPAGLAHAPVCAETGLRAGEYCPLVVKGRVLARDRRTCEVHRRYPTCAGTGHLLCRACMGRRQVAWQVFTCWEPDVEMYLEHRGKLPLPSHAPDCTSSAGDAPRFVHPQEGSGHVLAGGGIPVKVFSRDQELFFFVNGLRVDVEGKEFRLPIAPGRHALACIDTRGRTARVNFECLAEHP